MFEVKWKKRINRVYDRKVRHGYTHRVWARPPSCLIFCLWTKVNAWMWLGKIIFIIRLFMFLYSFIRWEWPERKQRLSRYEIVQEQEQNVRGKTTNWLGLSSAGSPLQTLLGKRHNLAASFGKIRLLKDPRQEHLVVVTFLELISHRAKWTWRNY